VYVPIIAPIRLSPNDPSQKVLFLVSAEIEAKAIDICKNVIAKLKI
jgi:hypothetical protein